MNPLLYLAKNITISNFTELNYPYKFTYILTYKCQFRCIMCNIWRKSTVGELSLEQIKTFFKKSNKFSWINLGGGEIFLRKDLLEIIESVFKNCKYLYLLDFPTTGFQTELIVGTVKNILAAYKIPRLVITISLDGPPRLHDQIRNTPDSWDRAVETFKELRKLRSKNFKVFFGMTLQASNADKFEETLRSASSRIGKVTVNDFHINIIHYSRHYYQNTDSLGLNDEQRVWSEMNHIAKLRKRSFLNPVDFLERRYQALAGTYLDRKKIPIPCQALSASVFMDPSGNVYPCTIFDKLIGNIVDFDYDIYKLLRSANGIKTREEIRGGNCPQCWTPCEAYQSILASLLYSYCVR